MILAAHCFFRQVRTSVDAPIPCRAAIVGMLAELELALQRSGVVPVALRCESWQVPARPDGLNTLGRITIEAEAGNLRRSLASWYQWQHPQWRFSGAPPPAIEHVPALEARP